MPQITSRVPDEVEHALSRWAADEGLQRSDLIRNILGEACAARRDGRVTFQQPEALQPVDLIRLVATLGSQTTELERILRQNAKRDGDLARQARADTLGVSSAREAITADVAAHMRGALELVHGELVRTREELAASLERLPQLAGMAKQLGRIETLAKRDRTQQVFNIGFGEWTWPAALSAFLIWIASGMVALVALLSILPPNWGELRFANRMLGGGDRAICRLIDYHYDTGLLNCRTSVAARTVTVTASAPARGRAR